jgi:Ca2+-binding RTX toxin-like protein
MADFIGTAGKDQLVGTADPDNFDMSQGGNDKVEGRNGDDVFNFGAAFTGKDKIDGGNGFDLLTLNGDYSAGVNFTDTSLVSVEAIEFAGGHSYTLKFTDANFAGLFIVDGRALGAAESLNIDMRNDTDGFTTMFGGAGDDTLRGGGGDDAIVLTKGGADIAIGGAGADIVSLGAAFGADDRVDGGAGADIAALKGDYVGGLAITKPMMQGIETLHLEGAFDYDITLNDKVAGASLSFDASGIEGANHNVVLDAHREKNATITLTGSSGNDRFTGGDGSDSANFTQGGNDTGIGGLGSDSFNFGATLTDNDRVDGGGGFDSLLLNGDYSAGFTFKTNTMQGVEQITLFAGNSYSLIMNDANVAAGATLGISASGLVGAQTLIFDGTAETDGDFLATGGAAADTLDGGAGDDTLGGGAGDDVLNGHDGDDTLAGGGGADILNGGAGTDRLNGSSDADIFVFNDVSESTGAARDTIVNFTTVSEEEPVDKIDLAWAVTAIDDLVDEGSMDEATLDTDLAAAIGTAELGEGNAVVFVADDGDLEGHTFLIVDHGGGAGYQAGLDLVIEIETGVSLTLLELDNFI